MKIFLTGGSGFIGKKFIKEALKAGHTIYAVTRKQRKKKRNLTWLKGGVDKDWSRYLKKSKVLVHMAAAGVNKNIGLEENKGNNRLIKGNYAKSFSISCAWEVVFTFSYILSIMPC